MLRIFRNNLEMTISPKGALISETFSFHQKVPSLKISRRKAFINFKQGAEHAIPFFLVDAFINKRARLLQSLVFFLFF